MTPEQHSQWNIRAYLSKLGCLLFRNNIGAGYFKNGTFVRFGLANESAQMNKRLASSDLIGIRPIRITPDMVGSVVGQFLAIEVKPKRWKYRGGPSTKGQREEAQKRFIDLVKQHGGDACFMTEDNLP